MKSARELADQAIVIRETLQRFCKDVLSSDVPVSCYTSLLKAEGFVAQAKEDLEREDWRQKRKVRN